jgi:hypothetical protein
MQQSFWWRMLLLAVLLPQVVINGTAQNITPTAQEPCSGSAWHAFDFWLGSWVVMDVTSGSKIAQARIEPVSHGCALREEYRSTDGGGGESLSSWDAKRGVWRQYWVSTSGAIVSIKGKLHNGAMTLSGAEQGTHSPDMVRGTWKPKSNGVRETGERSWDGGRTWEPWFDLEFRRAEAVSENGIAEDRQTVANLDELYQAAVKINDSAIMGRLLDDDFVLVTDSGKIYTRAQLLAEASSGHVHYEHQEDTNRTVRIWGDTAVVTASLWEKGSDTEGPFDKKIWFSGTYVRRPEGWKYVFGQSSLLEASRQGERDQSAGVCLLPTAQSAFPGRSNLQNALWRVLTKSPHEND